MGAVRNSRSSRHAGGSRESSGSPAFQAREGLAWIDAAHHFPAVAPPFLRSGGLGWLEMAGRYGRLVLHAVVAVSPALRATTPAVEMLKYAGELTICEFRSLFDNRLLATFLERSLARGGGAASSLGRSGGSSTKPAAVSVKIFEPWETVRRWSHTRCRGLRWASRWRSPRFYSSRR